LFSGGQGKSGLPCIGSPKFIASCAGPLTFTQFGKHGGNIVDDLADRIVLNGIRYVALATAALVKSNHP
jgi:hypothetical protein